MIRIGTYIVKNTNLTSEEKLRLTKNAGFDFVCIGAHCLYPGDADGYTPELCAGAGLDVDNVHLTSNGAHALWAPGEEGDMITERYIKEIALCLEYGIKTGITHVTWGKKVPPPIGEIGLSRFKKIVECAEKYGFTVAIENSVYPEYLHYVMSNLKSKYVGYCFDSGHRNAFAPQEDFLGLYGSVLAATHLQDNEGKSDLHLIPGDGCIDWNEVCPALAGTAFGKTKLCSEVASIVRKEKPGASADEIRKSLSRLSIIDDEKLLKIYDGGFSVYENLSYEEYLDRLVSAVKKIAAKTEAAIQNRG